MGRIVVAGGGICGMAAALMLRRDGHEVVVLERDGAPVPTDPAAAWEAWARRSVGQFRIAHLLLPGGYAVVAADLPDVAARLVAAGAYRWNPVEDLLAAVPGGRPRPDDDRFTSFTARRPTLEWAFATTLAEDPGIEVRRGVALDGFVVGDDRLPGVPHVIGVRVAGGEEVLGDLVIDATGRRSATCEWLREAGAAPAIEESEDLGFTYTGRFWRSGDGTVPAMRAPGLAACGSISLLTVPSDNGTWSTTVFTASDDAPLRRIRSPEVFERVWRAFPDHAHWLDGEPISDVTSMSGTVDRHRRFVCDGKPLVTGVLTIGDAHACTNPSIGRGITIGLRHTRVMRDTVRAHADDPGRLAVAFDDRTQAEIHPWHEATASLDRARMAQLRACVEEVHHEPSPEAMVASALAAAAARDEEALRWYMELLACVSLPTEVLARPGVFERVLELAADQPPPEPYGPDRRRLLELVT